MCYRYDPDTGIVDDIDSPQERVQFLQNVAQALFTKARIKLNIKRLYAADGRAVRELLKLANVLYRAAQQADADAEVRSATLSCVQGLPFACTTHWHFDSKALTKSMCSILTTLASHTKQSTPRQGCDTCGDAALYLKGACQLQELARQTDNAITELTSLDRDVKMARQLIDDITRSGMQIYEGLGEEANLRDARQRAIAKQTDKHDVERAMQVCLLPGMQSSHCTSQHGAVQSTFVPLLTTYLRNC